MFPFDRIKTLRTRLILLVLAATVLAATMVGGTLTLQNYSALREAAEMNLRTQADVIAAQGAAVIAFDDPTAAIESLALLRVVPEVGGAWMYKVNGELFASFEPEANASPTFLPGPPGERRDGDWIVRSHPIVRDHEVLGTLVMSYDLGPLLHRIRNGALMSIVLGTISAVVALLLAIRMQRIVSRPIAELADVAELVTRTGDFAIRARKYGDDELGELTDVTNDMLTRIERQAAEIQAANENFRVAVESAPNSIVKFDSQKRIVMVNQQTEQLFGYSREELLGQSIEVLVPQRFRSQGPYDRDSLFLDPQPQPMGAMTELFGLRKDGSEFPIAIAFNPIETDAGPRVLSSIVDVTERKRQEEALRESEARLAMAQAAGRVGTFDWNIQTDQIIWSAESQTLFGLAPSGFGASYQSWKALVHPEDRDRADRDVMESIRNHTDLKTEYRVIWPDGSVHWIMASGRSIDDQSGRPLRLLGVNVDITERKRSEEERAMLLESERAARGDAERASRMKDEFVATLSHELRTPMTAVLGWSQMLRRGKKTPEDLANGLEIIERNARMQSQIIDDLLDMSRIISGKVRLDVQQVDLAEVIDAALGTVRPAAEAKEIRLNSNLDPLVGPVRGDPNRLQQIIWNLLSNAIKFTPRHGRVEISLVCGD